MRFNKQIPERRSASKKAALQYVMAVGDRLDSQKIKQLTYFLQRNGWHEEELTDLVVAQAFWDDYTLETNDIEGVVMGIKSLTESTINITLGTFKTLIYESLLIETTCPLCGDLEAYVGLNNIECPNHKCRAFSEQQASDVGRNKEVQQVKKYNNTPVPSKHVMIVDYNTNGRHYSVVLPDGTEKGYDVYEMIDDMLRAQGYDDDEIDQAFDDAGNLEGPAWEADQEITDKIIKQHDIKSVIDSEHGYAPDDPNALIPVEEWLDAEQFM